LMDRVYGVPRPASMPSNMFKLFVFKCLKNRYNNTPKRFTNPRPAPPHP
jgi:hypothetical protein